MHQLYKKIPWWEHQKLAMEKITKYIKSYDEGQTQDYSLISTPTGTGKTGIIAGVAQLCYLEKSVLVIAPRVALRDQLHLKIRRDFFSKFGQLSQELPKEVIRTDENIPTLEEFGQSPKILVSTIQKLVYLESNEREKFDLLINSISLILFDEGHYEPARRWRQIIEQFNCPKVIFTATPFRNDLRPFKIAPEYSYLLTMDEAIEKNIVRDVEIKNFPMFRRDSDFIENVVSFYETHRQDDNRVLIRCTDSDEISRLSQFLVEKGFDVVGIHENFSSSSHDWLVKKVPNPNSTNADIWLHQYKLLEGIDDSRFSIAAIYGQLGNTRSVIQQIGRIIRNPEQLPNQIAWVLDWDNHLSQIWDNFRRYDSYLREQHEKSLLMLTDENWSLEFLNPQPDYFYFDRNIRKKIDFDDITIESEIQVPLRMNLYEISDDYEQDILVDELCERLNEYGSYVKTYKPRENATVILYIEYSNSRYLKTTAYLQDKLNLIILYSIRNYVCYYDSSGRNLKENEFGIIRSVDRKQLKKLFNSSMDSKLTRVSMKNSNIGLLNIRSKSISAASIGDLPPLLDDRSQVITTAYGLSIDTGLGNDYSLNRRYVGFRNGKVSEYVNFVDFPEYLKWADKIVEIIDRDSSTLPVFNRFAEEVEPPEQTNPTNILLDLIEVQDDFETSGNFGVDKGQLIQIQDICLPVQNKVFWLQANGLEIPVSINFDERRKKYEIESHELKSLYEHKEKKYSSLVDYLNREQAFRIIPDVENRIYVNGEFFKPFDEYDNSLNADELDFFYTLEPIHELSSIGSEKGDKSQFTGTNRWPDNTLFNFIDTLGKDTSAENLFGSPDILVCEDMQKEIADFIIADSKENRVVFIHAKASPDPSFVSASNLYDVCAQANKNLGYLSPYQMLTPKDSIAKWEKPWESKECIVLQRVRKGDKNGEELWREISSLLKNPNTQREVWLVLGQTLSKSKFRENLKKQKTPANAIQVAYLLRSTLSNVSSIGGKLRILCSE